MVNILDDKIRLYGEIPSFKIKSFFGINYLDLSFSLLLKIELNLFNRYDMESSLVLQHEFDYQEGN